LAHDSKVLPPAAQQQVGEALEDDAEVLSDTQLEAQLKSQPPEVKAEILSINEDARHRALQVALLVPILAGALGMADAVRMRRRPDPKPSESAGMAMG
jgi:hypothetical protein